MEEFTEGVLYGKKCGTLFKMWETTRVAGCCRDYWEENISSLLSLY
jgi:hypothetical protein